MGCCAKVKKKQLSRGAKFVQRSTSYLNIIEVTRMGEENSVLRINKYEALSNRNLVAWATWHPRFVHP